MLFADLSRGHRGDIELIDMYNRNFIEIMSINSSYYIEFSRIRQLMRKLSSETSKEKFMCKLDETKVINQDHHEIKIYLKYYVIC